jgi:hypothetical protein
VTTVSIQPLGAMTVEQCIRTGMITTRGFSLHVFDRHRHRRHRGRERSTGGRLSPRTATVTVSRKDVQTDETKREIIAYNESIR